MGRGVGAEEQKHVLFNQEALLWFINICTVVRDGWFKALGHMCQASWLQYKNTEVSVREPCVNVRFQLVKYKNYQMPVKLTQFVVE